MANQVAFRRINGHVVPIRVKNAAEGAALAGAGVAVAAAAGTIAARMTHAAASIENQARKTVKAAKAARTTAEKLGPLFSVNANRTYLKAGHEALKSMTMARQHLAVAKKIAQTGRAAGATVIAAGVHHALSGTELDKNPKTKAAIAAGSGVAAHFAIKTMFVKKLGTPKTFDAIKKAAKAILLKKAGG